MDGEGQAPGQLGVSRWTDRRDGQGPSSVGGGGDEPLVRSPQVLADIELAQTLQAAPEEEEKVEEVPHPLDRDYQLLRCQLQLLDPEAPEYKVGGASPSRQTNCGSLCPLPTVPCPGGWGGLGEVHPCLWPWAPRAHSPAGDPHLPEADGQQPPEPGAAARLESEPRRRGEQSPEALPIPARIGETGVLA